MKLKTWLNLKSQIPLKLCAITLLLSSCVPAVSQKESSLLKFANDAKTVSSGGTKYSNLKSKVIGPKCIICHSATGSAAGLDFNVSETELVDQGYIVAGDADNSPFYYRLKGVKLNKSTEDMPLGVMILTAEELGLVKEWINSIKIVKVAPPAAPAPTPTPAPMPMPEPTPSLTGVQAFEKYVYKAITKQLSNGNAGKCVSCHTIHAVPHTSATLATAYDAAKSKVNFNAIESSIIATKAGDGHCSQCTSTTKTEMLAALNEWKKYDMNAVVVAPPPTPMPMPEPTPSPTPSPAPVLSGEQAFEKYFYKVISKQLPDGSPGKCVSCHTVHSVPHTSANLTSAYQAAKSKVNFNAIESSILTIKAGDAHCPSCNAATKVDVITQLYEWKKYDANVVVAPPPVVDDGLDVYVTSGSNLRNANTTYILSALKSVFGPTIETPMMTFKSRLYSIAEYYFLSNTNYFGSPCDSHSQPLWFGGPNDTFNRVNFNDGCDLMNVRYDGYKNPIYIDRHQDVPVYMSHSSGRFSLQMRACEKIVASADAINFAIKNIDANANNTSTISDDYIKKAYLNFNPGKPISNELVTLIKNQWQDAATNKSFTNPQNWSLFYYQLCVDPSWQTP